jgi:hypothetical protein
LSTRATFIIGTFRSIGGNSATGFAISPDLSSKSPHLILEKLPKERRFGMKNGKHTEELGVLIRGRNSRKQNREFMFL